MFGIAAGFKPEHSKLAFLTPLSGVSYPIPRHVNSVLYGLSLPPSESKCKKEKKDCYALRNPLLVSTEGETCVLCKHQTASTFWREDKEAQCGPNGSDRPMYAMWLHSLLDDHIKDSLPVYNVLLWMCRIAIYNALGSCQRLDVLSGAPVLSCAWFIAYED